MSGLDPNDRKAFLGRMYDQMFNDINTHILVVWQSAGVLVASFAILALAEKNIVPIDLAVALLILIAGWLLAHLEDAAYWYNRNLMIIANIERQFLLPSDLKEIHYYFGKHRRTGTMIDHLRIQYVLGAGVAAILLAFHFLTRIVPGMHVGPFSWDLVRCLPYAVALASAFLIRYLHLRLATKYREFITNSPGIEIATTGITYGVGHPAHEAPSAEDKSRD